MIIINNDLQLEVPIFEKITLSFTEAARYSGIGEKRLRALADRHPELAINIDGRKRLKRKKLEDWIERASDV